MGFQEFAAFHGSIYRNYCSNKISDAQTTMIAAQGTSKQMKEWLAAWMKVVSRPQQRNDVKRFLEKFGDGF